MKLTKREHASALSMVAACFAYIGEYWLLFWAALTLSLFWQVREDFLQKNGISYDLYTYLRGKKWKRINLIQ